MIEFQGHQLMAETAITADLIAKLCGPPAVVGDPIDPLQGMCHDRYTTRIDLPNGKINEDFLREELHRFGLPGRVTGVFRPTIEIHQPPSSAAPFLCVLFSHTVRPDVRYLPEQGRFADPEMLWDEIVQQFLER